MTAPRETTGMVLGKFLPPHRGHQYLIDFARHHADHVTVIVGTLEAEPIPGALRFEWMKRAFPDCTVVHLTDENPQEPHEHPDFWRIWHDSIRRILPDGPDRVFASEDYGFRLAEILGATYVPVDHGRELVPVSGRRILEDPYGHWEYLLPSARPHFVKRVSIVGPESTGKSVLAKRLADHFHTVHVSEYARGLLHLQGDEVRPGDIPRIARGQRASENAMAYQANRVLICDTDLITTTIWSDVLFGECPEWIRREADRRTYDLYLLADIDTPWIDDPQRFLPHRRQEFLDRCIGELEARGRPYVRISGSWDDRFERACEAIVDVLATTSGRKD